MNPIVYYSVKKIIDAWDPLNLFPMAPPDEYESEIRSICERIEAHPSWRESDDIEHLAKFIGDRCDGDFRHYDWAKYMEITQKIIDAIQE